jgi:hypothetical protein
MTATPHEIMQPLPTSIVGEGFVYSSFKFHENGLEPIGDPTMQDWLTCGRFIYQSSKSIHFVIGDWLAFGEFKWRDSYREAVALTGFKYQTLADDKWVSSRIELSRRRDNLSFEHHKEVAKLPDDQQEELLSYAEDKQLNRDDFRKVVRQQTMQDKPKLVKPEYTPSEASRDAEQIRFEAQTLITHLSDLDAALLPPDERKHLKNTLLELERKINAIFMFDEDYE